MPFFEVAERLEYKQPVRKFEFTARIKKKKKAIGCDALKLFVVVVVVVVVVSLPCESVGVI